MLIENSLVTKPNDSGVLSLEFTELYLFNLTTCNLNELRITLKVHIDNLNYQLLKIINPEKPFAYEFFKKKVFRNCIED